MDDVSVYQIDTPSSESGGALSETVGFSSSLPAAAGTDPASAPSTSVAKPKWQPKALTAKHKTILSLWAQGESRQTIAELCKCVPEYVTMLAATNLGSVYVAEIQRAVDDRLNYLTHKSVEVINEGLANDQPMDTRLKAAALQLKASGRMKGDEGPANATAEDVIARIMNLNVQVNVQR